MEEKIKKPNRFNEERWTANYQEATDFFMQNGYFPRQKDNMRIYQWATQWWRNVYLKKPESVASKAEKLLDIGFSYMSGTERYDIIWMKNFNEAKAFFEEHGHFPTFNENKRLRSWVRTWWNSSAARHPDKVELLKTIGYAYETVEVHSEKLWFECYRKAKAFYNEYGRFPKKGEGGNLRNWATRWWRKSAQQQPGKALLLRNIGFTSINK